MSSGQIIPFNFPLLMAAWKVAPALAAGNCSVLKPASPTPWSILKLAEVIADVVPPGVLNIVNGPGAEIGKALGTNKRIQKIAFTGETTTGRLIMQYAAQSLIPSTTELGGKSPNIFFADVMAEDDEFLDKAIEGLVLYAFNKGEVCTCPSRALIQESIYDEFMARCLARIATIRQGDPLDPSTQLGAQVSTNQLEKITNYVQIGLDEGAELLIGGHRNVLEGELADGYYFEPTVFRGHNKMRIFQEEIFGPVLARHDVQGRGRGARDRERHDVRPRRRRLDARRVARLPHGPRHPGRPGVDELLPPLPGPRRVRRLQVVGRRAREPQDDARALLAGEVPARQLRPQAAGAVLSTGAVSGVDVIASTATEVCARAARAARAQARPGLAAPVGGLL